MPAFVVSPLRSTSMLALLLAFLAGVISTVLGLALLGRARGHTGPNSRVRVKEDTVAVLTKGAR